MKSILLVDDDLLVLNVLERLLRSQQDAWRVSQARGGTEALASIADARFDLLITDIRMPEPDGAQVIRDAHRRWPSMKIIAMSGGGQPDEAQLCRELLALGADEILQKPFSAQDLFALVRRLLAPAT
ncbi:MAG TPA: response regulator transcription factor [Planctomycetota bacterium]|nr:response regulator transcription factor [Planctomycetota bacterium]